MTSTPPASVAPLCVILLNYNGWRDTLACVDSLFASTTGFTQLIVCDNASLDGSYAKLEQGLRERALQHAATWQHWHAQAALTVGHLTKAQIDSGATSQASIVLIDNQANIGFARGNNVGLRLAQRHPALQLFWLLNNDTEVRPDTIQCLTDAAARRPEVGLWGCTVLYHGHPDTVQALGGGAMNRRTAESRHIGAFAKSTDVHGSDPAFVQHVEREMDYPLGAAMLATRAWLNDVGLMGEQYFLYYEELDWAWRGRSRHALGYAADAWVFHKEGASIGTAPSGGTPFSVFHLHRSRLLFARLRLPRSTLPAVVARSAWQSIKMALKRQTPQARAALRGMWAGLTEPLAPSLDAR